MEAGRTSAADQTRRVSAKRDWKGEALGDWMGACFIGMPKNTQRERERGNRGIGWREPGDRNRGGRLPVFC